MKNRYFLFALFLAFSCEKQQVYAPVGGVKAETDLDVSKEMNKGRNNQERKFIQDWIGKQSQAFYPTSLNYWSSVDLKPKTKRAQNHIWSYGYELYDLSGKKIYDAPLVFTDVIPVKIHEIKAIEDALYYLGVGEEVTLLVPSALAYGTYGDQNKIPNDLPLLIKLKLTDIK